MKSTQNMIVRVCHSLDGLKTHRWLLNGLSSLKTFFKLDLLSMLHRIKYNVNLRIYIITQAKR